VKDEELINGCYKKQRGTRGNKRKVEEKLQQMDVTKVV